MWACFVLLRASIGLESAAFEAARVGALAGSEEAAQAETVARQGPTAFVRIVGMTTWQIRATATHQLQFSP